MLTANLSRNARNVFLVASGFATIMVALALPAHAAMPTDYQPTVSVRIGSLGVGPELSVRLPNSNWGLRANLNVFDYSDDDLYRHNYSGAASDGRYIYNVDSAFSGSVRLLNGGLTADYYPLGTGLRVSAGVYVDGNRVTAKADPTGFARVDGIDYLDNNAGTLGGKALLNTVAPYVGIGYAGRLVGNLVFSADLGVLVEGDPRVSIATSGPIMQIPALTQQVEQERNRISRDVDIPVYPVAEIGLGWRF